MADWGDNNYPKPIDFIGIKCSGKDTVITFPIGFQGYNGSVCLSDYIDGDPDRFMLFRDDARLLVDVLLRQRLEEQSKNKTGIDIVFGDFHDNNTNNIAPAQAWYFLINDFLSNGYWSDPETVYQEQRSGKIDWKRTIKRNIPYMQNDNAIYLNFIVRQSLQSESSLISSVHKWCVYESFMRIGWLFSNYMPDPPNIRFQHNLFLSAINDRLSSEFDDIKRLRLLCMRAVVQHTYEENETRDYQIGTNKFEKVWETMVDHMMGTEFNEDKEKYYPKPIWFFGNSTGEEDESDNLKDINHRLRPDTIMISDEDLIVLDAKYRQYSRTGNKDNLPWATEINKQITYGEYAQKKSKDNVVYNAFVLPFDGKNNKQLYDWFGLAKGNWKNIEDRYAIIQGIFVDTKYLMKEYTRPDDQFKKNVADLIKRETENYIKTITESNAKKTAP